MFPNARLSGSGYSNPKTSHPDRPMDYSFEPRGLRPSIAPFQVAFSETEEGTTGDVLDLGYNPWQE